VFQRGKRGIAKEKGEVTAPLLPAPGSPMSIAKDISILRLLALLGGGGGALFLGGWLAQFAGGGEELSRDCWQFAHGRSSKPPRLFPLSLFWAASRPLRKREREKGSFHPLWPS
jgi:hypothetical protein